jgi:hypothetical protein
MNEIRVRCNHLSKFRLLGGILIWWGFDWVDLWFWGTWAHFCVQWENAIQLLEIMLFDRGALGWAEIYRFQTLSIISIICGLKNPPQKFQLANLSITTRIKTKVVEVHWHDWCSVFGTPEGLKSVDFGLEA